MGSIKKVVIVFITVMILVTLSGCERKQASINQSENALSQNSVAEEESNDKNEGSMNQSQSQNDFETDDTEVFSKKEFLLIAHATVSYSSYSSTLSSENDKPADYFDIASPYETYSYYEDSSPLLHEIHYDVEDLHYEERWEKDENGNISMFDGRTGDDQIAYMYDDNNHLIQEWRHRNYWPSSVTIYSDYDEHGNYGSTEEITSWGGSLFKQGDPWYDLDYIDYGEVRSTTHHYYKHEYDEMGRLISTTETRYDGSGKRTHTYEYDSQGNLVYEYDSGDEYIREYHSNGEIALLQVKWRDQLKEEIVYDTHGNPISKFSELDYAGTITTYENEYDINGNLVRRFTYDKEGNCKYYDIWQYVDKQSYIENYADYLPFD